ncbi:MAG: hypothetical protein J6K58_11735 [Lachnospiraceae bacterium]|nr:hypothetical protein [Lachnospiraceae bacterium]
MRKITKWYVLGGSLLILLTGAVSMTLGMGGFFRDEINKTITETTSSFLGSIYLAFLLGRFRKKEWEHKKTAQEIKTYILFGLLLFSLRSISRLVFCAFDKAGQELLGYLLSTATDLLCLIFIYIKMPAKEEGETYK